MTGIMFILADRTATIDVSWTDLAVPAAELPALTQILTPEERARAERLRFADAQRRFIAGRAFLRQRLGAALGRAPEDVALQTNAHGKPEVVGASLHFNVSHSGDTATLAITETCAVGIDIERRRDVHEGVAAKIFSKSEQEAWAQGAPATRNARLLKAWTRKEAALKALGAGFRFDPRKLDVSDQGEVALHLEDRHILIRDLPCPPDFEGALAVVTP